MEFARYWRHVAMTPWKAARCFPAATMERIGQEISAQEKRHRGEVCFVAEAELSSAQLWRGMPARERAREVFAAEGVWNTEENNGVLIYVLLADRDVEIVADRGIAQRVPGEAWSQIVDAMDGHFAAGRFEEGALHGVRAVSDLLAQHFPADSPRESQLADRPRLI